MKSIGWLGTLVLSCWLTGAAWAGPGLLGAGPGLLHHRLERVNKRLCGTIVDFTQHHGADNRIWSNALCQKRDMYVYLPPGYDPAQSYPAMLWLHGFLQDENAFLNHIIEPFDRAMASGKLPPLIIVAPDGTLRGRASILGGNSFFLNSDAGNFEDYLFHDVWPFLVAHFPIRPEREAHMIAGVSMGGFAAYNLTFKHRDLFKTAIGIYPPLNLRWVDCHGRYRGNFDPNCWGWRTSVERRYEIIGQFYGIVLIPLRKMLDPLFGHSLDTLDRLSLENPLEMLDRFDVHDGDFDLFVAYGGRDEFNLDAQIESFLYAACQRGIHVGVHYAPRGRHNLATALHALPRIIDWLAPRLAPFHPCATPH